MQGVLRWVSPCLNYQDIFVLATVYKARALPVLLLMTKAGASEEAGVKQIIFAYRGLIARL